MALHDGDRPSGTAEIFRENTSFGELVLKCETGAEPHAMLWLDGALLMDSDIVLSERALAAHGMDTIADSEAARVFLGGLGLGITLRELLLDRRVARVDVVEILAPVVGWNRTALAGMNGGALTDPRVRVVVGDLRDFLMESTPPSADYDLMLFDIDNGPDWLSLPANAWLYSRAGLEAVMMRLRAGGAAVYWAGARSVAFEARLAAVADVQWSRETLTAAVPTGGREITYDLYFVRHKPRGHAPSRLNRGAV